MIINGMDFGGAQEAVLSSAGDAAGERASVTGRSVGPEPTQAERDARSRELAGLTEAQRNALFNPVITEAQRAVQGVFRPVDPSASTTPSVYGPTWGLFRHSPYGPAITYGAVGVVGAGLLAGLAAWITRPRANPKSFSELDRIFEGSPNLRGEVCAVCARYLPPGEGARVRTGATVEYLCADDRTCAPRTGLSSLPRLPSVHEPRALRPPRAPRPPPTPKATDASRLVRDFHAISDPEQAVGRHGRSGETFLVDTLRFTIEPASASPYTAADLRAARRVLTDATDLFDTTQALLRASFKRSTVGGKYDETVAREERLAAIEANTTAKRAFRAAQGEMSRMEAVSPRRIWLFSSSYTASAIPWTASMDARIRKLGVPA